MKKACRWQSLIVVVLATLAHAQEFLPYQTIVPPTNDTVRFGRILAVSGTSLAIADLEQPRRVFVYEKNEMTGTFEHNSILTNPNTRLHATFYGTSLNLMQDGILAVGDTRDRTGSQGQYAGAVFVYRKNPASGTYELLQTLRANNRPYRATYGSRVVVSSPQEGDSSPMMIAIGVPGADLQQGAIYVYTWNDSTGLFGAAQKVVTQEWRRPTLWNWWLYLRPEPDDDYDEGCPRFDLGLGYTLAIQGGLLVSAHSKHYSDQKLFAFERSAADGLFRERSPGPLEECRTCYVRFRDYGRVFLGDNQELIVRDRRFACGPSSDGTFVYASPGPFPLEGMSMQQVADKGTFIATGGGYLVICDTEGVNECNVFRKNVQTALWEASGTLVLAGDGDCQVNVGSLSMDEEKTVVVGTYCPSDTLHDSVLVYELP